MPKPTTLPTWATDVGAEIIEPVLAKKQQGWIAEDPPHEFFNWWQNNVSEWTEWLDSRLSDTELILGTSDNFRLISNTASVIQFDTGGDVLSYTQATDTLSFDIASSRVLDIDSGGLRLRPGLLTFGTSESLQLRLDEFGSRAVLQFDTGGDALSYVQGTNTLSFDIAGFRIFDIDSSGLRLRSGRDLFVGNDNTFSLRVSDSGDTSREVLFDGVNNRLLYSRNSSDFRFVLGGSSVLHISSNLGDFANALVSAGIVESKDSSTTYGTRGIGTRFINNTITAAVSTSGVSDPTFRSNTNRFNVFSIVRASQGTYTITYDRPYSEAANVFASVIDQETTGLVPAFAMVRSFTTFATLRIYNTSGALVDGNFSFVAVGGTFQ